MGDWGFWGEKGSSEQWHSLATIGCLLEPGSLRPAPGEAEEGSDEDAFRIDDYLVGGRDMKIPIPVLPPKTKSAAPYDVMPQDRDPTSRGSGENTRLGQIPERPAEPKPGPPEAPRVAKAASPEIENVTTADSTNQLSMQTMPESHVAPARVSIPETVAQTPQGVIWMQEGSRLLGFGSFHEYTYREAWNWICAGTVNTNNLIQGSSLASKEVLDFLGWMQRLQQAMDDARAV